MTLAELLLHPDLASLISGVVDRYGDPEGSGSNHGNGWSSYGQKAPLSLPSPGRGPTAAQRRWLARHDKSLGPPRMGTTPLHNVTPQRPHPGSRLQYRRSRWS